jgi:hypothetical protein
MLSSARWFLAAGGCILSSDCAAPLCAESLRFIGVADDGAACSADGALCSVPVPCALANPVPAISAAAATDIIKRLVMEYLLTGLALPTATNERRYAMFRDVAGSIGFVL